MPKPNSGIGREQGQRKASSSGAVKAIADKIDGELKSRTKKDKITLYGDILTMRREGGSSVLRDYLSSKGLEDLQVISRAIFSGQVTRGWKDAGRVREHLQQKIETFATQGEAFR